MKAILFNPTIPRFLVTKVLSAVSRAAVWGPTSPLQYRDIAEPPLPGEDWVRVGVRLGAEDQQRRRHYQPRAAGARNSLRGHQPRGSAPRPGRAPPFPGKQQGDPAS